MDLANPSRVVLAGSPAFLNAALPPLAAALGVRPRVADAPHQVFALCQDGALLLVCEHRGREWLALVEDLKTAFGDELRILVAVPGEHAAAGGALAGAGADEVLSWSGRPEALAAAAARLAGRAAPGPGPAPPSLPHPATPPPPAAGAVALGPEAFPADPEDDEGPIFSIVEAPPDAAAAWGDAELVAFEPSGTWPGTLLASRDAEGLLAGALAGFWPELADLRAHTERAVAGLSPLERDAVAGRPVPADPAPLCRAAALRWQVSAARATAPPPGSPVDAAAVRAILAEIDAVLAELKRASRGAPPGALPALDQLRRDLVAGGVDLTEAVHRIAPRGAAPPEAAARAGAAGRTRLLSVQPSDAPVPTGERRRQAGTWVALGLAVTVGAAYHGWRSLLRPAPPPMPRAAGAPAGFVAPPTFPGPARLFTPEPGKAAAPAELERLRATEALKGNRVQEIRGVLVVVPDGRAAPPRSP